MNIVASPRTLLILALVVCVVFIFGGPPVYARPSAIPLSTAVYSQNFDILGTSATADLPADWTADKLATVRVLGTFSGGQGNTDFYAGNSMSSTANHGIYNYAAGNPAAAADRALGFVSSTNGTKSGNLYAHFTNTAPGALAGVIISYKVEKYRMGSNTAGFSIQLYYSSNGSTWASAGPNFLTSWPGDAVTSGYATAPGDTKSVVAQTITTNIPVGADFYLAWNYSVSSGTTTSSAQALGIDDVDIQGILGSMPTNPTAVGAAAPSAASAGDPVLLTVAVTPGTNPTSTGLGVMCNLTAMGGVPSQMLYDDGTHGDVVAGNNTFSFSTTVGSVGAGVKSLGCTVADAQSRTGSATISLAVAPATSLSGVGAAAPSTVPPGAPTLLKVTVTPATGPASTGLAVSCDLSTLGGASAQPLYDDGTNGDAAAGDHVFSYRQSVSPSLGAGSYSASCSISDAQSRTATANIGVSAPTVTHISAVQGASHQSPLAGTSVTNLPGIVTATRPNGFYLQDTAPDGDAATSDAVFVFTSSAPSVSVGDLVLANGTVSEYRSGGASGTNNLTATEITSPAVNLLSSANPLPAPIIIGAAGRLPPTAVIENDAMATFDPTEDGLDFYESLEGMRVQVDSAVAVGPSHDFGSNTEIPVIGDNGDHAGVRSSRNGIVISAHSPADMNPERIILNDNDISGGAKLPEGVNVGDGLGTAIGIMDYSYGNYKLLITQPVTRSAGGISPESLQDPFTQPHLRVATFNVNNLAATDPDSKFQDLASIVISNLGAPDLLAVEEIQDNNGTTDNGVVDASETWSKLIQAVGTQSGGAVSYEYRQINPVNDAEGGAGGGNIRVGFLFRTDRGLAFVDRSCGGCNLSSTAVSVINTGSGVQLSHSPGRIAPTDAAWSTPKGTRRSLVGEFTFNGHKIFALANHFKSKGDDDALYGDRQPPVETTSAQRALQAGVVNDFVQSILALDANADVIVMGDINDFQFSDTLAALEGTPAILYDLVEELSENERYTYVYDGNSEALDHILLTHHPFSLPHVLDVVHVNAEFATRASDHDPQVLSIVFDAPTAVSLSAFAGAAEQPARLRLVFAAGLIAIGGLAFLMMRGRRE